MADRGTFPNNATFIANAAMLTSLVVGDTVTIAGTVYAWNGTGWEAPWPRESAAPLANEDGSFSFAGALRVAGDVVADAASFAGPVRAPGIKAPGVRPAKTRIVSQRLTGITTTTSGTYTLHLCRRAPAHFDAIQLVLRGNTASAINTITASVAPTAKYNNGWAAVGAADAPVTRTAITWGSTDKADFWNAGGGAANTVANEASGSAAGGDLRENAAISDWIFVRSLDRADNPTLPPLYHVRIHGTNIPAINHNEFSSASGNPITSVDPEFYSGYWAANYTITEAPSAPSQSFAPSIEVRFLLRDKSVVSIACFGDSIDQGWIPSTAVPQFGGQHAGWCRKMVASLAAQGVDVSYFAASWTGQKSRIFHNQAFRALQIPNPGITHLFVKPWSVNENADGIASAESGISRTNQIIAMCDALGIVPIITQPWAGQNITGVQGMAVAAYCDQLRAEGRNVFDARTIVDPTGSGSIQSAFLTRNSGGEVVDNTHLNEAGQTAVAAYARTQCASWGIR